MVTFAQLRDVDLEPLATTAGVWERFAQALKDAQKQYDTNVVAKTDEAGWKGLAADAARKEISRPATRLELAAAQAGSVAGFMRGGYDELRAAKQRLKDALSDASAIRLRIGDDGALHFPEPRAEDALDPAHMVESIQLRQQASKIHDRFEEAVRLATTADERLAGGLSRLGADNLEGRTDLAKSLADTLANFGDHPVNLPPGLVELARQLARRHGISDRLMLMTLWQEQQWYQNHGGYGPFSTLTEKFGNEFNKNYQKYRDETKSMGISHMKAETARDIVTQHGMADSNGRPYSSYNDQELAERIEDDPQFALDLTARYLADIQNEDEEQPWSDKQTFLLYAVGDDEGTREANRQYGDSTEDRKHDIRLRAENWDRVAPVIDVQQDWERLSPEDRQRALDSLGSSGRGDSLNLPYAQPHAPSPQPGPSPRPSGG
ncbi:hypothetical protein [Actinocorallia aurantiaca]|uniref:PPE family protein n=1 Tax=Actinocorallia aurantiaca TaxID=46204 RepID=A0ABN3UUT4_9ACTN